jgi:hypothetical protein
MSASAKADPLDIAVWWGIWWGWIDIVSISLDGHDLV